jgi:hypothetical protein
MDLSEHAAKQEFPMRIRGDSGSGMTIRTLARKKLVWWSISTEDGIQIDLMDDSTKYCSGVCRSFEPDWKTRASLFAFQ